MLSVERNGVYKQRTGELVRLLFEGGIPVGNIASKLQIKIEQEVAVWQNYDGCSRESV